MQSQRFFLHTTGVLAVCLFSVSAHANLNGIAQRSGKQGAGAEQTCMASGCHSFNPSAAIPTVVLTGPATLAAGATGNYTLTISGGAAVKGGMNVAVSNNGGTLNPAGGDLKILAGELTHTAPKGFTNNEVRFDFTLVAPAAAGTSKLFASGNSTNGNGSNDGDRSASTSLDVQITGGSQPDAGMPDGGTDPGKGEDDGGCSAAGGAPLLALLALIAVAGLGRRVV
jgi:uncharacterized protein (TIGR03382 family)